MSEYARTEPMGAGTYVGLVALSIFAPPAAIAIEYGCEHEMMVEILLWLFVPFGGMIYAIYKITQSRNKSKRKSRYPLAEVGGAGARGSASNQQGNRYNQQPRSQPSSNEKLSGQQSESQESYDPYNQQQSSQPPNSPPPNSPPPNNTGALPNPYAQAATDGGSNAPQHPPVQEN